MINGACAGLGLVAAGVAGCSSSRKAVTQPGGGSTPSVAGGAVPKPIPGGTLKSGINIDADTWDPVTARNVTTFSLGSFTYSRLLKFKTGIGQLADGSVEADSAVSWEQPDPLTLTFHLRDNVKYDPRPPLNGRAMTAQDVVMTWQRFAAVSNYKQDLANAVNADAPVLNMTSVDPKTVQVKLAFPFAPLLHSIAYNYHLWIMPNGGVDAGFDPAKEPHGSGPYLLDSYRPSVGFSFKKNPNYWGLPDLPRLDGVELPIITASAQADAQFKSKSIYGEIGGASPLVLPTDVLSVHKDLKGTAHVDVGTPVGNSNILGIGHLQNSPFKDLRVRQAVSMLLDRDGFIDVFYSVQDFANEGIKLDRLWNSPLSAGYGKHWLDPKSSQFGPNAKYYQHNVAEARKLLAAAGYANGFETVLTTLSTANYGLDWQQRGEALAGMLADGGIKAKINAIDYVSVWVPQYLRGHGNYEGLAMGAGGSEGDAGLWFGVWLSSKGGFTIVEDNYPELDKMISDQNRELDDNKRTQMLHDIQRWCAEQMPAIPQPGGTPRPTLAWNGFHGQAEYFPSPTNGSFGTEFVPYIWLEPSLRG